MDDDMSVSEKGTILIVDDEEMVRTALEMVLESEGYRILTAVDGIDAIKVLHREKVDLVITDIRMPRADGLKVLKAAKTRKPSPKVIMMTGFASEGSASAIEAGADGFIFKVFRRAEVVGEVARLLGEEDEAGQGTEEDGGL